LTSVLLSNSKYGQVLVLEAKSKSFAVAKDYHLGFRIDPADKLHLYHQQIKTLWKLYQEAPLFGTFMVDGTSMESLSPINAHDHEELELIVDNTKQSEFVSIGTLNSDKFTMGASNSKEFVYDEYLGLATEPLSHGVTTKMIWNEMF
jgi:hypothetical protein